MCHIPVMINRVRQYALVYVKILTIAIPSAQLFHVFREG